LKFFPALSLLLALLRGRENEVFEGFPCLQLASDAAAGQGK